MSWRLSPPRLPIGQLFWPVPAAPGYLDQFARLRHHGASLRPDATDGHTPPAPELDQPFVP